MDWREKASQEAWQAFLNMDFKEQITGIGYGGYVYRNYGHGYQPHNGILLILIEAGMIGLIMYLTIVVSIIRKSFKSKSLSPLVTILLFFFFYCIGQNGELTSGIAFLFIGSLIAENRYNQIHEEEDMQYRPVPGIQTSFE
jgi:O-antigen ligase